ncbi:MotA/TolQ/ExbB proton channel family protein [candidate division KSB1 bacterium]|nr:MotA/TolQ/ExbB proton channel family protein [candidate division KSB1 bacterium]
MGSIIQFFRDGGSWMYPILLFALAGYAIVVERIIYIAYKNKIDTIAFVNRVLELLQRGNLANAIEFCRMSPAVLPKIIRAGLEEANKKTKDVQQAFELATMLEIPKLERRTQYLGVIANICTLLGLLGTIFGLIMSFQAVANAPASQKAILLMVGISTALNTTAFGLVGAIPCMLAHSFLQEKTKDIIDDININITRIFNRLAAMKG